MEHSNTDIPSNLASSETYGEQNEDRSPSVFVFSKDMWPCVVSLLTFSLFVSMTSMYVFYGSVDIQLGPNCSRLLQTNSFFVKDIKVSKAGQAEPGNFMLHGFHEPPTLDVHTIWLESYNILLPSYFRQEWIYYLNKEAQINITYKVQSNTSDSLILVIAQGAESFIQWVENPAHPNITSSWNIIHGSGIIQHNILKPSGYYVAVGNLNQQALEVQLEFKMQNILYNTTKAYYKCHVTHNSCVLGLQFLGNNAQIISSSQQARNNNEYNVTLSYNPRYITYLIVSGVVIITILLGFNIFTTIVHSPASRGDHYSNNVTNTEALLQNNVDDNTSLGSSYDSVSNDDGDDQESIICLSKLVNECDLDNSQVLCSICCDDGRNCFFLPCGHCATCFACGTRIAKEAGNCPFCRRKTRKVRRILLV